jgi:hypothetical protein
MVAGRLSAGQAALDGDDPLALHVAQVAQIVDEHALAAGRTQIELYETAG